VTVCLTTEDVGADVGGTSSLVLEQVLLTDQVFPQAEVSDSDAVGSANTKK